MATQGFCRVCPFPIVELPTVSLPSSFYLLSHIHQHLHRLPSPTSPRLLPLTRGCLARRVERERKGEKEREKERERERERQREIKTYS
ncbi:hypothetical protein FHG87_012530 [Trinorchestia longiramus]|nr:hypothetical protein FHG87_012530 [Trinorchestia longiramus]